MSSKAKPTKLVPEWKAIELYKKTDQKLTFLEWLKVNNISLGLR